MEENNDANYSNDEDQQNMQNQSDDLPLVSYEESEKNIEYIDKIPFLLNQQSKIQKIILSKNQISDVSQFFIFPKLIYLDLSFNKISKLENLSPLINLEALVLSNNNIKAIGFSLVSLKKLQHLDLGYNLLEVNDGALIKSLKFNPDLISLVLNGNINYDFEKCKYFCLDFLNKIELLDTEQIYDGNKANVEINKSFVTVTGKGGKVQKVKRLKDYIRFKQADIEDNKEEYDKLKDKEFETAPSKKGYSSYYYLNLYNSMK